MGRQKHRILDYKSTGTGEVIHVPTREHSDAANSVLQFFALVAYPHISERDLRDRAVKGLHAAFSKAGIWPRRNNRSAVMQLPPADRKMKIRTIQQQLNKWSKRISRRLTAGNMAARFYYKGLHSTQQTSGHTEILIRGPNSTREALHESVRAAEKLGIYREHDDAMENERKYMWLPSMPVLHLALVMYTIIEGFDEGTPFEKIIYELHAQPEWLHGALLRAEVLRIGLQKCMPDNEFDHDKAARMLPSESSSETKA